MCLILPILRGDNTLLSHSLPSFTHIFLSHSPYLINSAILFLCRFLSLSLSLFHLFSTKRMDSLNLCHSFSLSFYLFNLSLSLVMYLFATVSRLIPVSFFSLYSMFFHLSLSLFLSVFWCSTFLPKNSAWLLTVIPLKQRSIEGWSKLNKDQVKAGANYIKIK